MLSRLINRSSRLLLSSRSVAIRSNNTVSFATAASTSKPKHTAINTKDAPAAVGPYSHATKANGFVFVSGSLGLDPKTGDFPGNKTVIEQTKQSLDNIVSILKSANSSMDQVVKTTILLADIKDFPEVNKIYATYWTGNYPARATYAVKDLPKGALVEIEAIATHN